MKRQKSFDKYDYYLRSVQDPQQTLEFIDKTYAKVFGHNPKVLGEDFCGTFAMSCTWTHLGPERRAVGVDRDPQPIRYGMRNYFNSLEPEQQKRVQIVQADVRSKKLPKVDVIASMNFSYFIFKERNDLLEYFKNCLRRLNRQGMLLLDCFGGWETSQSCTDRSDFDGFKYFWEQMGYDPITHEALFYIHYHRAGEKKRERVFRYDWRMWSIGELRDLLHEVGFRSVKIYWEGSGKKGEGNGIFTERKHEQNCPAWIAYISATR